MQRVALLLALAAAGCGGSDPCSSDPSLCADASLGTCTGQCVNVPESWNPGFLLWLGPEGSTLPTCPDVANRAYPGYADTPPTTVDCAPCTCTSSQGFCLLSTQMSANGAACPGDPSKVIPFDAPDTWDGTCTAMDAIPSASSLLASPPYLNSMSNCFPASAPPIMIAGGKTRALVCENGYGVLPGQQCLNPSETCTVQQVPGFLSCIFQGGDQTCPDGWPVKHLEYDDSQECGCNCGAPTGDQCTTTLTVYSDGACMNALGSAMLSSEQPQVCIDTTPGSPYGSMSSSPVVYQSGTCMPTQTKSPVSTFCCQQ
jgi:hypothetical protein